MLALNMCSSFVSRGYQVILCLNVKVKRAIPRKKMYTGLYDVVYAREETKPLVKAMLSASQHQNSCYGHEPVY